MWFATRVANDGEFKVSAWWLFATYLLVAWGELCLSPMGLSLVNKMAPSHLRAFMMGGWFVSTGIGYKLSGIFGETYQKVDHYAFWDVLVIANLAFAVLIFLLVPWLNRQMADEA